MKTNNKIYFIVALLTVPFWGFGQEEAIDSVQMTANIVVSASKMPEKQRDLAQQVQVISAAEMLKTNASTTADLLEKSGEVFVQKSQLGGGSPVMRGFEANKILLTMDGIRINNLIFRGGHLQNIISTDGASLEKVELLYGSSSAAYGSDALGGVVALYSNKAMLASSPGQKLFKGSAFARYGSAANEKTGHLDLNFGSARFASRTMFTYSNFDDLRGGTSNLLNFDFPEGFGLRPTYQGRSNGKDTLLTNANPAVQVGTAYSQWNLIQKLTFKQDDRNTHSLNFQYSSSTNVPRYDRLTDASNGIFKKAEWYYGPQVWMLAAYTWRHLRQDNSVLELTANVQHFEESRHDRSWNSSSLNHRNEAVWTAGVDLDWMKKYGQNHDVKLGVETIFNDLSSTANKTNISTGISAPLDTRYADGLNHQFNGSMYGTHVWRISPKFTLNEGLRVNYFYQYSAFNDKTFFTFPYNEAIQRSLNLTGQVGLVYAPVEAFRVSLLGSSGYRNPNIDDLSKVFESVVGSKIIVPNPSLRAERTYTGELHFMYQKNRNQFRLGGWYTLFSDAIVAAPFRLNGQDSILYGGSKAAVYANQNQASAYITGVSTNFNIGFGKHFFVNGAATWTLGNITPVGSEMPLDHIPPIYGRLTIGYDNGKWQAEAYTNFNFSKSYSRYNLNGEDNQNYAPAGGANGMPAWVLLGVRASYNVNKNFMLQLAADNLLDTAYRTFASGMNGAGRNLMATARFKF